MDEATASATVDFILSTNCPEREVRVTFYGGEALLALGVIRHITSRLIKELGQRVRFGISTNGLLLKPDVIDWTCGFRNFDVYVSVDSFRELHDKRRVTVGGAATYDKIMDNLSYFSKHYPERYVESVFFLVTLESWSLLPEASRRWDDNALLRHRPPVHLSFVMPRGINDIRERLERIDERRDVLDLAIQQYSAGDENLLTAKFREWTDMILRNSQSNVDNGNITVTTCVEDFYRTFISTEGDIYICERFKRDFLIGSVTTREIDPDEIERLEARFIDSRNERCGSCEVAPMCTMCMTALNHTSEMMDELCRLERRMIALLKEYAWKRRMVDRRKQLGEGILFEGYSRPVQ